MRLGTSLGETDTLETDLITQTCVYPISERLTNKAHLAM